MKKLIAGTMVALSVLAMTGCSKNNGEKWYYYTATERRQNDKLISSKYEVNYYVLRVKYSSNCLEMQSQEKYGGKADTQIIKGYKSKGKYYIVSLNVINKDKATQSDDWFIVSNDSIKMVHYSVDETRIDIFKPQLVAI